MLDSTCELLSKLIAFRTVSSASNLDLIDFCRGYLSNYGIESHLVVSEDGQKANLYATIGPKVEGGVVLSGHLDVVPVDGQVWATDPWTMTERDGKLFGRGTADMKGFIALALAAAPHFARTQLARPIHLAFSYDEEVGCRGGRLLIKEMAAKIPRPCAVIVGEPTGNKIANGHKSYTELLTQIKGHAVHSGRRDLGASAVSAAARLIAWLDRVEQKNARNVQKREVEFLPPYTTLHCGAISGGMNATTVAESAWFTTDIRAVPWDNASDFVDRFKAYAHKVVEPQMRTLHPACEIQISLVTDIPGLAPEPAGQAESLVRGICRHKVAGAVPYGTEAGLFQGAGWSTVVCGPGNILQAHRADEFIEISELAKGAEMLEKLAQVLT